MYTQSHMSTAPRVRFLRKALTPTTWAGLQKLLSTTEILITTPLKLHQLTETFFDLGQIRYLVIDEADKMFEMGFLEQIDSAISHIKDSSVMAKFLFSATMQPAIEELLKSVMDDPLKI